MKFRERGFRPPKRHAKLVRLTRNANADPEYQQLQQECEEKLKTDPALQKQAEEKKRREI